jgi:hypothetical protein
MVMGHGAGISKQRDQDQLIGFTQRKSDPPCGREISGSTGQEACNGLLDQRQIAHVPYPVLRQRGRLQKAACPLNFSDRGGHSVSDGVEFWSELLHDLFLRLALRTRYRRSVKPPSLSKSFASRSTWRSSK